MLPQPVPSGQRGGRFGFHDQQRVARARTARAHIPYAALSPRPRRKHFVVLHIPGFRRTPRSCAAHPLSTAPNRPAPHQPINRGENREMNKTVKRSAAKERDALRKKADAPGSSNTSEKDCADCQSAIAPSSFTEKSASSMGAGDGTQSAVPHSPPFGSFRGTSLCGGRKRANSPVPVRNFGFAPWGRRCAPFSDWFAPGHDQVRTLGALAWRSNDVPCCKYLLNDISQRSCPGLPLAALRRWAKILAGSSWKK